MRIIFVRANGTYVIFNPIDTIQRFVDSVNVGQYVFMLFASYAVYVITVVTVTTMHKVIPGFNWITDFTLLIRVTSAATILDYFLSIIAFAQKDRSLGWLLALAMGVLILIIILLDFGGEILTALVNWKDIDVFVLDLVRTILLGFACAFAAYSALARIASYLGIPLIMPLRLIWNEE